MYLQYRQAGFHGPATAFRVATFASENKFVAIPEKLGAGDIRHIVAAAQQMV